MERINEITSKIKGPDQAIMKKAQAHLDNLTKPQGSLGRLEELAKLIVGVTGCEKPILNNKVIFTFAGDHGVVAEGVSAFPQEVTPQMVYNFIAGGAGINVLARHVGARVIVADLGVAEEIKIKNQKLKIKKINFGTKNMAKGPAMTRPEAIRSIEAGIEIFEEELVNGIDIAGTGDMGIGNTTPSSAITAVFTNTKVADITGRGTGIDDKSLQNKIAVIEKAIALNNPDANDPIDVLAKVGGFEIGGLCGVILAACANNVPVVIDGFISGAAALVAYRLEPKIKDYLIAAHCSVEQGHQVILNDIGLKALFDLNLRLGEGTGAALGIGLADAATKILNEMATFEHAGVSEKEE